MSKIQPLTDTELHEIERAARSGSLRDSDRLDEWVTRLVAAVRDSRAGGTGPEPRLGEPQKRHGDALIEGNGSRHGAEPRG